MIARLPLLILAGLLVSAAPRRDVDVVVSAGSPSEWLNDLSRPTPTRHRTVPGAAAERATVTEQAPRVFSTDVYRFAKITTVDLIGEIPWTVRRDSPTPGGGGTPTPGGAGGVAFKLPTLTDDVLWLGLALLLRRALHPGLVSESEAEEYLVYLGEGALLSAQMASAEGNLRPLCQSVISKVGPVPTAPPAPPKGKNALEGMLHRLTYEELTGAYPFAFDGQFARRMTLLGGEMVDYVIEATRIKHPFLRRNATLLLGRYPSASATDRLRELLEDPDAVVVARALDAVARRRDKEALPVLQWLYKRAAPWPSKLSVIRAMGLLGDTRAIETVRAHLKSHSDEYESTVACITALSRLTGKGDAEYIKLLQETAKRTFTDLRSNYQPLVPDPPGARTAVVRQRVQLALARAGHAPSADEVLSLVRQSGSAPPVGFGMGGMRSPLLNTWHAPVIFALLETLRSIPKGDDALYRISADRNEDLSVRIRAMAELGQMNPPALGPHLRKLAVFEEEFSVANVALHVLSTMAANDAVESCRALLAAYTPGLAPVRKALVAEAVGILAQKNKLDPALLQRIVEFEIIAQERGLNKTPVPRPDPNAFGRGAPMNFEAPISYFEEIVVVLGKMPDATSRSLLRDVVSIQAMAGRAEAAVALGTTRDLQDAPALLDGLRDRDPWVRFMAYRALKYLLGKDSPCDWIYGSEASRTPSVVKFAEWVKEATP